ncbi:hypothetical protein [Listeria costaricensis]|uniref:hypothetical protein n=1 Tax=Listeria costaricensis TaxID=2026604 RepID=UPI000C0896A4|nr:hypothetical protein [Listeria costaricensis]
MNYFTFVDVWKNKLILTALLIIAVLGIFFPTSTSAMWEGEADPSFHFDENGVLISAPINAIFPDKEVAMTIAAAVGDEVEDVILLDELKRIKFLNLEDRNIKSLEGIQHLTELEILVCGSNKLTSLDVSQNKKLVELHCDRNEISSLQLDNPKLKVLYADSNRLSYLDTAGLPKLMELNVGINDLVSLDLTKNPELETLSGYMNNDLEVVDLSPLAEEKGISLNFFTKTYQMIDNMLIFR